jgi:hypothetical protein
VSTDDGPAGAAFAVEVTPSVATATVAREVRRKSFMILPFWCE